MDASGITHHLAGFDWKELRRRMETSHLSSDEAEILPITEVWVIGDENVGEHILRAGQAWRICDFVQQAIDAVISNANALHAATSTRLVAVEECGGNHVRQYPIDAPGTHHAYHAGWHRTSPIRCISSHSML
jgi:hypothetical protein